MSALCQPHRRKRAIAKPRRWWHKQRNRMPYESDRQSLQRGNTESPLQSAARICGIPDGPAGAPPAGQREIFRGRQERDLEAWAKESGCWLNAREALLGFVHGGEEHRVIPNRDLYAKATHAGRYGFTVIAHNSQPTLTNALPGEYLNRLLLSNRVFDDSVQLTGVTREAGGLVILTTQPTIVGEPATSAEMQAYFASRRFDLLPGFCAGYRGSLSFYRDLDQVAVFDAHPANFLRDGNGVILPIDGVVVQADDALAALLEELR
jgi:Serine/Threonine/Tyrosine Kinase found in polyvalent proteins